MVAIPLITGGICSIPYFLPPSPSRQILPSALTRHSPTLRSRWEDRRADRGHICYLTFRYVIDVILFPLTVFNTRIPRRRYTSSQGNASTCTSGGLLVSLAYTTTKDAEDRSELPRDKECGKKRGEVPGRND